MLGFANLAVNEMICTRRSLLPRCGSKHMARGSMAESMLTPNITLCNWRFSMSVGCRGDGPQVWGDMGHLARLVLRYIGDRVRPHLYMQAAPKRHAPICKLLAGTWSRVWFDDPGRGQSGNPLQQRVELALTWAMLSQDKWWKSKKAELGQGVPPHVQVMDVGAFGQGASSRGTHPARPGSPIPGSSDAAGFPK